jgi:hypothetical protein
MDVLTSTVLNRLPGEKMSEIPKSEDNRKPEVKTDEPVLRDLPSATKRNNNKHNSEHRSTNV